MRRVDDEGIGLGVKVRLERALMCQIVQIFQEQNPGGLFGVVEYRGATQPLSTGRHRYS